MNEDNTKYRLNFHSNIGFSDMIYYYCTFYSHFFWEEETKKHKIILFMDIKNIKKQGYKIKKQTIKIERKNDGYFIL